ncbi:alpha/beta fold hydrolase [uncultured Planktosalinus sp.]|uniref:YheT family hydrolase n=1 Tax=uncultured Planktosalinus sp. TaxID=1810935 RepID=UPI0030D8E090
MPLVKSAYKPSLLFKSGHFSTIYSSKLRVAPSVQQLRERIHLKDGDFLDIDWSYSKNKSHQLAILIHGLEGNAQRPYMKGVASHLNKNSWDTVAINLRGCSGEPNRLFRSYTAGATEDLEDVLHHILKNYNYTNIILNGFSLGGNLILKYLGERPFVPQEIKKAVVVSTPLMLDQSLEELNKFSNSIYARYFLKSLRKKIKEKAAMFPNEFSENKWKEIKSLLDFDMVYTSKAHGFKDAYDYYRKNSSLQFLPDIKIPVLILNAQNDSFLSPACLPYKFAENHKYIYLETPKYGGHVGFFDKNNLYYNEKRTLDFIKTL